MVEKKCITLIYQYDDNWIGGTYYILNIIKALCILPEKDKPYLKIIYNQESHLNHIKQIGYPHVEFIKYNLSLNLLERILNKISEKIIGKKILLKRVGQKIENLYPFHLSLNSKYIKRYYYWIPDFQERHLPQFFNKNDIKLRGKFHRSIVQSKAPIVFSSQNALNDFNFFYPENTNKKVVLRFVSILGSAYKQLNIDSLKEKYNIRYKYFLIPNQFWAHKNQRVVLEATKILKEAGELFLIVFTGKEYDARNAGYVQQLKDFVKKEELDRYVSFLGFIDRDDQLQLMKHSVAIIQPSLFEGWSTVVEDCKALNHFILVSDIPVHREQISENCTFFDPNNPLDLANKMKKCLTNAPVVTPINYHQDIEEFALKFVSIW